MTRTTALISSLALLVSAGNVATAHTTPEAYQVVEHFAAAVSAGDTDAAYALLSQGAVWSEYDLSWRVASTRQDVWQRLRELIAADARIELEVDAVLGEQRDALMVISLVGPWRCGAFTRFDADGHYARFLSLEYLRSGRSYDSGTYAIEAGVITTVSGDGSDVCDTGQLIRFRWDVIDADTFAASPIDTDCPYFARIAHMPITFRRLHEE